MSYNFQYHFYLREATGTSTEVRLHSRCDCGNVIPRSTLICLFLWGAQSGGDEHDFLEQRHLIPNMSRCRGHTDILE